MGALTALSSLTFLVLREHDVDNVSNRHPLAAQAPASLRRTRS